MFGSLSLHQGLSMWSCLARKGLNLNSTYQGTWRILLHVAIDTNSEHGRSLHYGSQSVRYCSQRE